MLHWKWLNVLFSVFYYVIELLSRSKSGKPDLVWGAFQAMHAMLEFYWIELFHLAKVCDSPRTEYDDVQMFIPRQSVTQAWFAVSQQFICSFAVGYGLREIDSHQGESESRCSLIWFFFRNATTLVWLKVLTCILNNCSTDACVISACLSMAICLHYHVDGILTARCHPVAMFHSASHPLSEIGLMAVCSGVSFCKTRNYKSIQETLRNWIYVNYVFLDTGIHTFFFS